MKKQGCLFIKLIFILLFSSGCQASDERKKEEKEVFDHSTVTSDSLCNRGNIHTKIYINTSTRVLAESVDDINEGYKYFKSFVTSITENLLSKLDELNACTRKAAGQPDINLIFFRQPLVLSRLSKDVVFPHLSLPLSNAWCHVDSPWVKLVVQSMPKLSINALFTWNERQFLIDQVLLAKGEAESSPPPDPFEPDVFRQYSKDYVSLEVKVKPENRTLGATDHIPPEVLWLFRRSRYNDRGGMFVGDIVGINRYMEKSLPKLAQAFFEQCLPSEQTTLYRNYKNIFDLRDIVFLEEYQIK